MPLGPADDLRLGGGGRMVPEAVPPRPDARQPAGVDPDGLQHRRRRDRRLQPDVAYPVSGEYRRGESRDAILSKLHVTMRDGIAAERAEIGTASVQYGRMVVVDAALDLDWDDDISADGLADVAFWGRHGAEVAAEVGAGPLTSLGEGRGVFGWRDLPVAEAERIARDLEARRSRGKGFVVDLRSHTEQWRHLEDLRRSRTRSVAIEEDGARLILFDSDFGYHLCFIGADLDAAGQLLRVIVDLEREPFA